MVSKVLHELLPALRLNSLEFPIYFPTLSTCIVFIVRCGFICNYTNLLLSRLKMRIKNIPELHLSTDLRIRAFFFCYKKKECVDWFASWLCISNAIYKADYNAICFSSYKNYIEKRIKRKQNENRANQHEMNE